MSIFSNASFPTVLGDVRSNIKYEPLSVEDSDNASRSPVAESGRLENQSDDVEMLPSEPLEVVAVFLEHGTTHSEDHAIVTAPPFADTGISNETK